MLSQSVPPTSVNEQAHKAIEEGNVYTFRQAVIGGFTIYEDGTSPRPFGSAGSPPVGRTTPITLMAT